MIVKKHNFLGSVKFALAGIKIATRYNRNIRIHFIVAVFVVIFTFIFGLSNSEKAIIAMIILLVISAEMINTAIEEVVDLVTKEYREEAKYAKDVSAGMVLIASTASVIVGVLIFLPHVFRFFGI